MLFMAFSCELFMLVFQRLHTLQMFFTLLPRTIQLVLQAKLLQLVLPHILLVVSHQRLVEFHYLLLLLVHDRLHTIQSLLQLLVLLFDSFVL
jgi:hypothetical protein